LQKRAKHFANQREDLCEFSSREPAASLVQQLLRS